MMNTAVPKVFRVETEADLDRIPFVNGMAAIEVPADLLDKLELKNFERGESPRLAALERSIRSRGYQPVEPITARIGRKGRWVVVNGGHRLTAARNVMGEFWTNLFRPKVESLYFVLFADAKSWSKMGGKRPELPDVGDPNQAAQMRAAWDRAESRMRGLD
ncbi:MAG: ParB N-terminal domain-containing protein [Pseudomonadota bacterium]